MPEPRKATIAELLHLRRDALGQTDAEAAEAVGVKQSTFQRWRTGKVTPDEWRIPALAAWLEVDWLLR